MRELPFFEAVDPDADMNIFSGALQRNLVGFRLYVARPIS